MCIRKSTAIEDSFASNRWLDKLIKFLVDDSMNPIPELITPA